ncbi:hypothetical protein CJ197_06405 [Brachybacterium sp. UMB0905]|nr:hypothetical protein CJ197_06405 [Brachybacterium sp. UMB0905]
MTRSPHPTPEQPPAPSVSAGSPAPTARDGEGAAATPHATRLPSRRLTVLASALLAGALAGTTRPTWFLASGPDLAGTVQQVPVSGTEAAPAVLALALAGLAAALATSLSSRWLRLLTGPVLILTGLGSAVAAISALRSPLQAVRGALAQATGVLGADATAAATAWPWICLIPALALASMGVLVLVAGSRWPVGSRYRAATTAPAAADPATDPAAAWDALTRGEDPSADDPDDDTDGPGPTAR